MDTRTDEMVSILREQLRVIKNELDAEREQRRKVQQELMDYKAYMEEPMYENETPPVFGDDRALGSEMEDRPNLPVPSGSNLPPVDDFQFAAGMPVSGSVGQGLSVQNQPSSSHVGASGNAGIGQSVARRCRYASSTFVSQFWCRSIWGATTIGPRFPCHNEAKGAASV